MKHSTPTTAPTLPCKVNDPELWFAERLADRELAARLCLGCPIRRDCLNDATRRHEPWGVWGGHWFADGQPAEMGSGIEPWEGDTRTLVTEGELAELLGITGQQLRKRLTYARSHRAAGRLTGRELPEPDYVVRGPGQNADTVPPHRWALATLQQYLSDHRPAAQAAPEPAREAA